MTDHLLDDLLTPAAQEASAVHTAYQGLYWFAALFIGLLMLCCLVRAIRGPRIADRVIAVNMMGTLVTILICVMAFLMAEGYLVDVAMIYTMLSFLAVVLLTKVYIGSYHARRHTRKKEAEKDA